MQRICILGLSVGGQGGQTFGDWLCIAAELAGHTAVARSKPMVAQRGGSVDFYAELYFNENQQQNREPEISPVFCPEPVKGHIDLLIGMEFLEFARSVKNGYPSPTGKAIANVARFFTTDEKLSLRQPILTWQMAKEFVLRRFPDGIFFNATQLARKNGFSDISANAILLGALAASGFLPLPREAFEGAIRRGDGSELNYRAFELGYNYVISNAYRTEHLEETPSTFQRQVRPFEQLAIPEEDRSFIDEVANHDEEFAFLLREACEQLSDYQDELYASDYLKHVREIFQQDKLERRLRLTKEFSRVLALRMSYEDAPRVAQEKLRPERLKWILGEVVNQRKIAKLYEVLGPDLEEIYGLLPSKLVAPLVHRFGWKDKPTGITMTMTLETTSLWGNFLLRILLPFRKIRRASYRFQREWQLINEWINAVKRFASVDYDLSLLVVEAGEIVRGYGHTRHRTEKVWVNFLQVINKLLGDKVSLQSIKHICRRILDAFFESPDGVEKAKNISENILNS